MKKDIAKILSTFIFFALIPSVFAQTQSHPLSQVTPIDTNLAMGNFNITGVNWFSYSGGILFGGSQGIPTADIANGAVTATKLANPLGGSVNATAYYDSGNSAYFLDPSAATSLLVVGNVGIGTTNPQQKLDVVGNINATNSIIGAAWMNATKVNASAIYQGNTQVLNTVSAGTGLGGGGSGPSTSLSVSYGSSAGTAVQGNVGLTCTGASTGLSGGGNAITLGAGGTCNSLSVSYGSSAGTAVQGNTQITVSPGTDMSGGGTLTLGSGGTVTLSDASTLATVTGRGASTSTELTLSGGIATPVTFYGSVGNMVIESSGGSLDFSRASYNYVRASSAGGILDIVANGDGYGTIVVTTGKVGITSTPSAQYTPTHSLDLSGNDAALASATVWISRASDSRLKTNISNFTDGMNIINRINPINFNFNGITPEGNDTTTNHIGLFADQLTTIAPYMAVPRNYTITQQDMKIINKIGIDTINKNTPYPLPKNIKVNDTIELYGWDANALDFIFINAFKEQQQLIESQNQTINQLNQTVQQQSILLSKICSNNPSLCQ